MPPKHTKMDLEEVTENLVLKLVARASIPFVLGLCVWTVNSQIEAQKTLVMIAEKLESTKHSVVASNLRIDETKSEVRQTNSDLKELERRVNDYLYSKHKVGLTAGGGNGS